MKTYTIEMDTLEAGLFLGNQLAKWSGSVVMIMKKPLLQIHPNHVMTYSFHVPYEVRGIVICDARVEKDKIIITLK